MNEREDDLTVAVELDADLPVTPPEIKLVAELLPDIIKDILQRSAELED